MENVGLTREQVQELHARLSTLEDELIGRANRALAADDFEVSRDYLELAKQARGIHASLRRSLFPETELTPKVAQTCDRCGAWGGSWREAPYLCDNCTEPADLVGARSNVCDCCGQFLGMCPNCDRLHSPAINGGCEGCHEDGKVAKRLRSDARLHDR